MQQLKNQTGIRWTVFGVAAYSICPVPQWPRQKCLGSPWPIEAKMSYKYLYRWSQKCFNYLGITSAEVANTPEKKQSGDVASASSPNSHGSAHIDRLGSPVWPTQGDSHHRTGVFTSNHSCHSYLSVSVLENVKELMEQVWLLPRLELWPFG